jgi:hypothetical protein
VKFLCSAGHFRTHQSGRSKGKSSKTSCAPPPEFWSFAGFRPAFVTSIRFRCDDSGGTLTAGWIQAEKPNVGVVPGVILQNNGK